MDLQEDDDLVVFRDVRVVRATASALLCRVGERSVWLPRAHISGKLWCDNDRGTLFIRRWVARDRKLLDSAGNPIVSPVRLLRRLDPPRSLQLVRRDPEAGRAH